MGPDFTFELCPLLRLWIILVKESKVKEKEHEKLQVKNKVEYRTPKQFSEERVLLLRDSVSTIFHKGQSLTST